jgi:hypothetical protein
LLIPKAVRDTRYLLTGRELDFIATEFDQSMPIPLFCFIWDDTYPESVRIFGELLDWQSRLSVER